MGEAGVQARLAYEKVREWDDVSSEAVRANAKVHVGNVFELCVEKGSELPKGNPLRKYKGRTVFQGNKVKRRVRHGCPLFRARISASEHGGGQSP